MYEVFFLRSIFFETALVYASFTFVTCYKKSNKKNEQYFIQWSSKSTFFEEFHFPQYSPLRHGLGV